MHLETLRANLFRSTALFDGAAWPRPVRRSVAAQLCWQLLLRRRRSSAASLPIATCLSRGESNQPVVFAVERDRDGRSYSARRVVARRTADHPEFLRCHSTPPKKCPDVQADDRRMAQRPQCWTVSRQPMRPGSILDRLTRKRRWPRRDVDRLASRCHWMDACPLGLTYLSDIYSGLFTFSGGPGGDQPDSLDHSVWFHRDPG